MSRDTPDTWLGLNRRTVMQGIGVTGIAATVFGGTASAQAGDTHGPFRNNRFLVEIDGVAIAGFSRVDIPDATIASVEYREGTDRPTARKLKGNNEYEPLVLEKGVTHDSIELYEWFKLAQDGNLDAARRSLAVVLLSPTGQPGPRWEFEDAWPARYNGPELDAMSNRVAVETLEILHEGMDRVDQGGDERVAEDTPAVNREGETEDAAR